jgi:VanZ family protein
MTRIFQVVSWVLVLVIVVLSVSPAVYVPNTGQSRDLEHLLIFLITGATFRLGYPNRTWILIGGFITFAAAIEIIQLWAPGRHARIRDFLIDAAALCIGFALSWTILKTKQTALKGPSGNF